MADTESDDLDQLQRSAERTRAELVHTVDALRDRVADTANDIRERISPEHLKNEVRDYVRHTGESLYNQVERKVRDNPLQAVAIGAAVAYPIVRLLGGIPAPLLMIGAGVALAGRYGSSGQQSSGSGYGAGYGVRGGYRDYDGGREYQGGGSSSASLTGAISDQASGYADQARAYAHDATDGVRRTFQQGAETAQSYAGQAAETAQGLAREAAERASGIAEGVRSTVSSGVSGVTSGVQNLASGLADAGSSGVRTMRDAASSAADAASGAYRSGVDIASDMGDRVVRFGREVPATFTETVRNNPLLVAGVGVVIGAAIAAAIPVSEVEDRLMGDASDALKERATDAASQAYDTARGAVSEVYEDVSRDFQEKGFSADTVREAMREVADKAKEVAEQTTQAVVGTTKQS